MNIKVNRVKIFVTIPTENTDEVRKAMCEAGAGVIGEYNFCSSLVKSIGTFTPSNDATPYIGENGKMEFVNEDKLEVICDIDKVKNVISALRKVHPYEEPAIDIVPLIDEKDLLD